jgi:hypothetical protein
MPDLKSSTRVAFALVLVVWGASAGRADEVTFWNSVALDILKENSTHPPKVGRDLAIVHSSIYDALNAIDRTHAPLFSQPSVVGAVSREAAVAAAAHEALVGLYPTYEITLDNALNARLAGIADGAAKNTGVSLGRTVADNMLTLRASDGSGGGFLDEGGTAPGQWRPTPPEFQPGLAPHWGSVEPFAIRSPADFRPGPPPALDSVEYAVALNEVKALGRTNSPVRTADQTQIAEFWNDYPGFTAAPAGKWNLIAQTVGAQQGNSLTQNARMFALLNLTLADAGIVCWDTKYTYELWRPEDAIRLADTDGNPDTLADPDWTPQWPSPAFPEYNSGHSSFSGASAEILSLFFGTDDIAFDAAAGFDVLPGVVRHYDSLSEAALEAGLSRVYGGIHFQFANIAGLESGRAVAGYVFSNYAQAIPAPGAASLILLGMACLLRGRRILR